MTVTRKLPKTIHGALIVIESEAGVELEARLKEAKRKRMRPTRWDRKVERALKVVKEYRMKFS